MERRGRRRSRSRSRSPRDRDRRRDDSSRALEEYQAPPHAALQGFDQFGGMGHFPMPMMPPFGMEGFPGAKKKKKKKKKKKVKREDGEESSSSSSSEEEDENWREKVWNAGFQLGGFMGMGGMPGFPGFPGAEGWPGANGEPGSPDKKKKERTSNYDEAWGKSGSSGGHDDRTALEQETEHVPIFLESSVEETVPVPKALIRKVIGKQAATIIEIRQKSGVYKLDARDQSEDPVQVKVAGTPEAVQKARELIHELLESTKKVNDGADFVEIPKSKIGMVMGPKGAQIIEIQNQTGAKIDIEFDSDPCRCYVKGVPENVERAKKVLLTITMEIEDETSEYLELPKATSGILLGEQGARLRQFQEESGARIDIDKTGMNCRVRLSGNPQNIAKAKRLIYSHTEPLMNPGLTTQNFPPQNTLPEVKAMDFPMTVEESIARAKAAAEAVASGSQPGGGGGGGGYSSAGFSMEAQDSSWTDGQSNMEDPYATRMHAIPIPSGMVGKIIGTKGATIKGIQAMAGCDVNYNQETSAVMVTGIPDQIAMVEAEINKLLMSDFSRGGKGGAPPAGQGMAFQTFAGGGNFGGGGGNFGGGNFGGGGGNFGGGGGNFGGGGGNFGGGGGNFGGGGGNFGGGGGNWGGGGGNFGGGGGFGGGKGKGKSGGWNQNAGWDQSSNWNQSW